MPLKKQQEACLLTHSVGTQRPAPYDVQVCGRKMGEKDKWEEFEFYEERQNWRWEHVEGQPNVSILSCHLKSRGSPCHAAIEGHVWGPEEAAGICANIHGSYCH